jgi:hypothetical protein
MKYIRVSYVRCFYKIIQMMEDHICMAFMKAVSDRFPFKCRTQSTIFLWQDLIVDLSGLQFLISLHSRQIWLYLMSAYIPIVWISITDSYLISDGNWVSLPIFHFGSFFKWVVSQSQVFWQNSYIYHQIQLFHFSAHPADTVSFKADSQSQSQWLEGPDNPVLWDLSCAS